MCRHQKCLKIPQGLSEAVIEKGLTTQWPKEKGQTDRQRSTKHYTEN